MDSGQAIRYSAIGNGSRRLDRPMVHYGASCWCCPPGKFAKLNSIAVIWELEVDLGGIIHAKEWEWK